MFQFLKSQKGIAALLTIIIISAASLIMAYVVTLLSIGDLDMAFISQQGGEAMAAADGCLEDTLYHIRFDPDYGVGEGEMTLSIPNGSCTITVTADGDDRTITITSSVGDYHKKIETNITVSGDEITINSWQEKSD